MQEELNRVVQTLTDNLNDPRALDGEQLKNFVQNTVNSLGDLYVSHISNAPVDVAAADDAAANTVFHNSNIKTTLNGVIKKVYFMSLTSALIILSNPSCILCCDFSIIFAE